jgi:DNA-binding XRE family transcriptional regulator
MTSTQYKAARQIIGTQAEVAARLQVSRVTVAKRETGAMVITREASLALAALGKRNKRNA